jgi:acyl-CoA reductase-like NAD-dependent aldehyde dehydrogenase
VARNHLFMPKSRLAVQKTYKVFIGGKFIRGESGRVMRAPLRAGMPVRNYCRASRKDFRDAVVAARAGLNAWSGNSGYLRGQILYRAAEMLETRRSDLEAELSPGSGDSKLGAELQAGSAVNLKRYFCRAAVDYFGEQAENPYWIADTTEMKTAWHPIGL